MKAKEYLQKIAFLDSKIESNKEKVLQHKDAATKKTSNLSPDKVQTSASKQKIADAVCSYSDLEAIIKADEEEKAEIINTICKLNPHESTVLYKCYSDGMTLWEVSKDMSKSYSWVTKVHSRGLKSIQNILDKRKAGD